jgi:signal transduction histidine kinase
MLLNLVDDTIDMGKLETGNFKLEKTTFLLGDVLSDIEYLFDMQATGKSIDFDICPDPKIYDNVIYTDRKRLTQILINIVGNSMKYTF